MNYESDFPYFVDEYNLCQIKNNGGTYIPDDMLFEFFTKL
jgi:hypothetical protein